MSDAALYLESLPVRGRVSGLSVMQADDKGQPADEHILVGDRPFCVQLTVELIGNAAIALLMLEPTLSIEVLVNPPGTGNKVELGVVRQRMSLEQRAYTPMLELDPPMSYGLESGLYHLTAMIRIGAEEGPALLSGVLERKAVEVFCPAPRQTPPKSNKRRR
jgi:hypothetical protein